ncbi:glutaminyl-peptide cyclotransferase-like [Plakobranchus ocellatus]|uniref:Glutaminyl-peptide cyclotransferase n=1 Tax=Plakobranchus ocellatus TaxID=259542 RepID=A0AAV3ZP26_9GAST|nr:glutaminyl-peptide cyclotransferase-like [Plakobranchus ocellatus]
MVFKFKNVEVLLVFVIIQEFCNPFRGVAVEADKVTNRPLRSITKDHALRYLTEDMSIMDNFKSHILKPFMIKRVSGTEGNLQVQQHIKFLLSEWGWHIEEERFKDKTPYGEKEFTNIIATYDPNKPVKVVLACHFDSKFFAKKEFVGATDSAVPCAIIMESVRQLQCLLDKGPKSKSSVNDITLQLIFFDGEEAFKHWTSTDSIYGARHLANSWLKEKDPLVPSRNRLQSIRELILLDLIGTPDTRFVKQFAHTSELYDNLVKVEELLRGKGFLIEKSNTVIFQKPYGFGGIEDDHIPFLRNGVDILHLISTPFPSVWHKSSDDWDHLDFNLIDNFSRIFRVFLSNLLHLRPEDSSCRKK